MLGENLDTDRIEASYSEGVLRLHIPVAEKAKPRKITIGRGSAHDAHHTLNARAAEREVIDA